MIKKKKKNEDFEGLPVMGILRNLKRGRFFRGARKLLKKKKKKEYRGEV